MSEFHHGPEVVENFENGRIVRDIKAATCFLIGTAPVSQHTNPIEQAKYINKPILVRSTADAVAAFGAFSTAGDFTIPRALFSMFNKDRGFGIGTIIVVNVFDPAKHASPNDVSDADIMGGLNLDGQPMGLEIALYTYGLFGYFPRRLVAPKFSMSLPVRTKMNVIAHQVQGHAIADLPHDISKQEAVTLRGVGQDYQMGDDRMVYCWPRVKALDPVSGEMTLQPFSQHFAGIWNEVVNREEDDNDGGVAASPSNRALVDVSGIEVPLAYYPGDKNSDTNLLNEAGIVTINMGIYGASLVTWGNRASSFANSADVTTFLHVRAMYDVLHCAILFFLQGYIDKRITRQRLDLIESQIQAYLNTKERDNWLYGATFSFNRLKNTPSEILNGRVYYKLTSSPVSVAERITVESEIDLKFVKQALNLTTGV